MIDPSAWKSRAAAPGVAAAVAWVEVELIAVMTQALLAPGAAVAVVWAVSLYGLLVDERLVGALAVVPRRPDHLWGIFGAPLAHGSFAHLTANTVPLLVLGGMVALRGPVYYLTTTLAIAVLGGLGLWTFGRNAAHVGASGIVFGYFGFLVGRGYYERSPTSVAVAVVVTMGYGGMVAGVLPRDPGVSWEAHLFGLLAGGLCARAAGGRRP